MRLGERRDLDRVVDDERGLEEPRLLDVPAPLDPDLEQVGDAVPVGERPERCRAARSRNTSSSRLRPRPAGSGSALTRARPSSAGRVRRARLVDAPALLGGDRRDRLGHAHAPEGPRERQRATAVLERPLARHGGGRRDQLLGRRHHVAAVEVGGVELEHRELGVVHRRDPLVPEVAVDLVDALEAAHHQPLQVELRVRCAGTGRRRARCGA